MSPETGICELEVSEKELMLQFVDSDSKIIDKFSIVKN
jgi:hypothetical protein